MSWRLPKSWRFKQHIIFVYMLMMINFWLDFVHSSPTVSIHVDENLIAQSNDSEYVAQIMRMSKSAEMRNFMNPEADVCDNFYEYACGNWPRLNPADTTEKRKTSLFDLLETSYKQKQLRLLNEDRNAFGLTDESEEDGMAKNDTNMEAVRKVKDFYKSCRKMSSVKKYKLVEEMKDIIKEFGIMPALLEDNEEWYEESEFDSMTLLGSIQHKYGFDIILQLGLRPDFDNKSLHTLFIGQPVLKLKTKSAYTGIATGQLREDYRVGIKENLEDFLGLTAEKASNVAMEILNFEIKLAQGLFDFHTDKTLKSKSIKRTPEELQTLYGENMNLLKFLETTLGYSLNVTCYEYTPEYHEILKNVLQYTPKRQVANYIMYQLVEPFFIGYDRAFNDMEDMCLERTKRFFSHVLDNMIYKSYDTMAIQHDILTIWQEIKLAFRTQMSSQRMEWLTPLTRQLALEKLERIQLHINSYENHNFTEEYEDLKLNNHDYMANLKELNHLRVTRFLQHLCRPGRMEWSNHQLSYSPAFINSENLILIPVSLLQPNYLWSHYYPQALKFGTLGFLLAHELIHGFDDIGHRVDTNGTELTLWWDEPSSKAFKHKKSCFKNQYARFRYNGKYLPISEMQSENIADNAAIQLAYKAYIHWLNLQALETLEELLPNMKLNNKKLFFLSFAQFFCVDVDDVMKDKVSLLDVHAPAKFRVLGPLANFAEFAKIFKCPQGSPLNPEKRCEVY